MEEMSKNIGSSVFQPVLICGVPEVSVEAVFENRSQTTLVDVRGPDEFYGELGHVEGSLMAVLGNQLLEFLRSQNPEEEIVFICRSGGRSGEATLIAQKMGFKKVYNMTGGMLRWNELKLPTMK